VACSKQLATLGTSMKMATRTREPHLPQSSWGGREFHHAGHKLFGLYLLLGGAGHLFSILAILAPLQCMYCFIANLLSRLCAADASMQPSQIPSFG